jgi:hypothetical protein
MDESIRRGKLDSILLLCNTILRLINSDQDNVVQNDSSNDFQTKRKQNLLEFKTIAQEAKDAATCSNPAIVDVTRTFIDARYHATNRKNTVDQQVGQLRFEQLTNTALSSFNDDIDLSSLQQAELRDIDMVEYQKNMSDGIRNLINKWMSSRVMI